MNFFGDLPKEILNNIGQYLNKSNYYLVHNTIKCKRKLVDTEEHHDVCNALYYSANNNMGSVKQFEEKLPIKFEEYLGTNYNNFLKYLRDINLDTFTLFGSFINQCYFNETYENSDIDFICFDIDFLSKMPRNLIQYNQNGKIESFRFYTWDFHPTDDYIVKHNCNLPKIRVFTHKTEKIKINIILLNLDTSVNTINSFLTNTFDLTCCKATYNFFRKSFTYNSSFDLFNNREYRIKYPVHICKCLIRVDYSRKKKEYVMNDFNYQIQLRKINYRKNKYNSRGYKEIN